MTRRGLAPMIAFAMLPTVAVAGPGGGFATGSCRIPEGAKAPGSGAVITVDAGQSIQEAVNRAQEGDTILVGPGVYREEVVVRTPGLRIRGTDRNAVILDGENQYKMAVDARADRVAVENMTARNYAGWSAFYWEGTGYWGRYLTAHNNRAYGLYAFDARCGQFDHSYASGHGDSGFYIGQCFPCDAVIHDVLAEGNALGYSGTNAGGNLTLRDSVWRNNALGIVPNSLNGEEGAPQRAATIINNRVLDNSNRTAPGAGLAGDYWGIGIPVAGGQDNIIAGNVVTGSALAGILLTPLPDPVPDRPTASPVWLPAGNVVWGNTVDGPDGSLDLAQAAGSGPNNCWADNVTLSGGEPTSAPPPLQTIWSCGQTVTPPGGDLQAELILGGGALGLNGREQSDWQTYSCTPNDPCPKPQPNQPDDDGDGSYANDGAVDSWLPALGL